jgi:hypothetical protein
MQKGRKFDSEKPRYSLIPAKALDEVAHVLTYGSRKYEDFNWKYLDKPKDRFFSAAQRHAWEWMQGEENDKETGRNHLASAICNMMFLLELELEKKEEQEAQDQNEVKIETKWQPINLNVRFDNIELDELGI